MDDLLAVLQQRPMLGDGGMGTQLIARGLTQGTSAETWNVENPDAVRDVHAAYAEAGCNLITTNSFQGSRTSLANHGLELRCRELNEAAAKNAKAAAPNAFVLADAGPFGGFLEPLGDVTDEQLLDIFTEQFAALHDGGADAALIETMSDPAEVVVAIKAAQSVARWPIVATYAFQRAGDRFVTMMGTAVDEALHRATEAGADIVGANCGTDLDLDAYLQLADELVAEARGAHVILQPNAGAPKQAAEGVVYPATPDDMAEMVPTLLNAGVRVIGGCCGTTPAHLAAMSQAMKKVVQA